MKRRPSLIVTNEPFQEVPGGVPILHIARPAWAPLRRILGWIPFSGLILDGAADFVVAARMVLEMRRPNAIGMTNLGGSGGGLFCLLNSLGCLRSGPVLAHRALLPAGAGPLRRYLIRRALNGAKLTVVWSRRQADNYSKAFDVPADKFIFLPYKANYSRFPTKPLPVGDYIFSGGNSERDYQTLFEAVEGLPIPVIVSTTKKETIRGLAVPQNVIIVGTEKHAFERLIAGSRLAALCLKKEMIRGSGEATMLNVMWHGKPLVVADDISARDYIEDGKDGLIVPAQDAAAMRGRILELWNDPERAARMGEAARAKVERFYTHQLWQLRMQKLALLAFDETGGGNTR